MNKKEELMASIKKELDQNPNATIFDLCKKYRIPPLIIMAFKERIEKTMTA